MKLQPAALPVHDLTLSGLFEEAEYSSLYLTSRLQAFC